jgi:phosphoribosylanthranilate isomerase
MPLKTFVKINCVNNLSDARYCAGMNVNLLGFDLDSGSDNYINPETFNAITGWTSGVQFVGEFSNNDQETIDSAINQYAVDYIESNDIQVLLALQTDKKKILNITIEDLSGIEPMSEIEYLIVSGPEILTESQISIIKNQSNNFKILLGCGVSVDSIDSLLLSTGAHGIALTAGDEIRPGYKDYDELADILEALEIDEWV